MRLWCFFIEIFLLFCLLQLFFTKKTVVCKLLKNHSSLWIQKLVVIAHIKTFFSAHITKMHFLYVSLSKPTSAQYLWPLKNSWFGGWGLEPATFWGFNCWLDCNLAPWRSTKFPLRLCFCKRVFQKYCQLFSIPNRINLIWIKFNFTTDKKADVKKHKNWSFLIRQENSLND